MSQVRPHESPIQWRSLDLADRVMQMCKRSQILSLPWVDVRSVVLSEGEHEANICQIVMNDMTVPEGCDYPSDLLRRGLDEAIVIHISTLEEILLFSVRDDGSRSRPRCMDGLLALQSRRRSPIRMEDISVGWLLRPSLRRRMVKDEAGEEKESGLLVLSELSLLVKRHAP